METLYLPTIPNIFGLKLQLLLEIFFVLVIILVLVFLLWYFIAQYRGRKKLDKQLHHMQSQASHLGKEMLIQKIRSSEGKYSVLFLVEYLERFATNTPYFSLQQLLAQHGFTQEEIESMMKVVYHGRSLDEKIQKKIQNIK